MRNNFSKTPIGILLRAKNMELDIIVAFIEESNPIGVNIAKGHVHGTPYGADACFKGTTADGTPIRINTIDRNGRLNDIIVHVADLN